MSGAADGRFPAMDTGRLEGAMRRHSRRNLLSRSFVLLLVAMLLLGGASEAIGTAYSFDYDGVTWQTAKPDSLWYMASSRETLRIRPGLITVSFDTSLVHSEIMEQAGDVTGVSLVRYDRGNWYDFRFAESADPGSLVVAFEELEGVWDAVPAFLVEVDATPNDDDFGDQWGLENTGQSGGTSDADIDGPSAWDSEKGDTTAVIAVIDTGADLDHDDLEASLWVNWPEYPTPDSDDDDDNDYDDDIHGYDFYYDDGDPSHNVGDWIGHGSHVAGIAIAKTNNSEGVAGVAGGWGSSRTTGSKLMTLKIGYSTAQTTTLDMTLVSDAIYYAVDNGADIINMSFHSTTTIPGLRYAAPYAWSNGVLMVAASGNSEDDIYEPASESEVMAVGATDHDDDVPSYSTGGSELNIVAPGGSGSGDGRIYSTVSYNDYGWKSGTSMSAPHVCGAAALALSADSSLSVSKLWKLLEFTTDDEAGDAEAGWDSSYGWGRLNAATAVDALEYADNSSYTYSSASCKVFCPAGDEDSFVITVTVKDSGNNPVAGVPASAIWAESKNSNFKLCCVAEDAPDCVIDYANRVLATALLTVTTSPRSTA